MCLCQLISRIKKKKKKRKEDINLSNFTYSLMSPMMMVRATYSLTLIKSNFSARFNCCQFFQNSLWVLGDSFVLHSAAGLTFFSSRGLRLYFPANEKLAGPSVCCLVSKLMYFVKVRADANTWVQSWCFLLGQGLMLVAWVQSQCFLLEQKLRPETCASYH